MTTFSSKPALNNKNVIATIASDGHVYSLDAKTSNFVKMTLQKEEGLGIIDPILKASAAEITEMGKQMLYYAEEDNIEGVQEMLAKGAPFAADTLGMTPIHFAAHNNSVPILSALLDSGVTSDTKTKLDKTPLHFAAFNGCEEIAEMILSTGKCAVNGKDMFNMTPLHYAVHRRHKNMVKLLLQYGADPTIVSKFGITPIGFAVKTEQADVLQILRVAKDSQLEKKFTEENAKEANDAVNSLLGIAKEAPPPDLEDDDNRVRAIICNHDDDDDQTANMYSMINMSKIDETSNKKALDMLKTHGIAMMPEEDPSTNLVASVIQNGRKLVLSEAGKLCLNDSRIAPSKFVGQKKPETNNKPTTIHIIGKNKQKIRVISADEHKTLQDDKLKANAKRLTTARQVFVGGQVMHQMNTLTRKIESPCNEKNLIKRPRIEIQSNKLIQSRKPTPMKVIKHNMNGSSAMGAFKVIPLKQYISNENNNNNNNNIEPLRKTISPALPLLSVADTSREISLLKKQAKEMKLKIESVQNENEQLRRRVDKLEGLKLENESLSSRLAHVENMFRKFMNEDIIEEDYVESYLDNLSN